MPDFHTTSTTTPEPSFQCRHILTGGHRCGSPTLRHEPFCYYHHTTRKPVPKAELEARDQRKARRAGLLLYGLQIASINLPPRQPAQDPADTVEAVELHPEHGLIAPEQDFALRPTPGKGKTLEQILMEDWTRDEAREAEKAAQTHHQPAEDRTPFILDNLQAVAQPGSHSHPHPNPPVPHSSQPHRDEWSHPTPPVPLHHSPTAITGSTPTLPAPQSPAPITSGSRCRRHRRSSNRIRQRHGHVLHDPRILVERERLRIRER